MASHFSFCSCTILWFSHCRSWLICRAHPPSPGSGCVTSLCDHFLALHHQIQTFSFISMILHYLSPLFIIFHQLLGCHLLPMTGDGCSAMCFLSCSLLNLGRRFSVNICGHSCFLPQTHGALYCTVPKHLSVLQLHVSHWELLTSCLVYEWNL